MSVTEPLFRDDAYLRDCEARVLSVDPVPDQNSVFSVVLDRSVFYPLGGGQLGDTGQLTLGNGDRLDVIDTRKGENEAIRHLVTQTDGLAIGDTVTATLNWDRRHVIMRYHTALHLLCSLIDAPVTSGSIQVDRARLDFDLPESPDKLALAEQLNALVAQDAAVTQRYITDAELDAQPELVRTMSVQPPRNAAGTIRLVNIDGIDLQPCGGTHVASTAEVGELIVKKIEKKGRQNRRINIAFAA